MKSSNETTDPKSRAKRIMARAASFQTPAVAPAAWQVFNSFALFFVAAFASWFTYTEGYSYLWTLCCSTVAGLLLLRIFIIQHDCGHGSFTPSRRANDIIGTVCSLFTLIPYFYWRRQHAIHHASNGNLDGRGHGDMDVLTVREYQALGRFGRLRYRIYRHPIGYLVLGPVFFFLVINRLVLDREKTSRRERANVWWTNAALLVMFTALGLTLGWGTLAAVALPMIYVAGAAGIWIFYIQHQFEHTYWKPDAEWDYVTAALQGSSYYELPRILQWFTGNIGFHHIHHLKPLIPNYRLEDAHTELEELRDVPTLTLLSSLKTMFLILWDEEQQRLISFRELKRRYPARAEAPAAAPAAGAAASPLIDIAEIADIATPSVPVPSLVRSE